ncbi:hypothetical protein OY671_011384, partial [Metschnikowia pulcherrima]
RLDAARRRTVPERLAVRPAAVPARRRADPDLRDHGRGEPDPRFVLHGGRVSRGLRHRHHRLVPGGRAGGVAGGGAVWPVGGSAGDPQALQARPPVPGAGHLRPAVVLERGGQPDLRSAAAAGGHPVVPGG